MTKIKNIILATPLCLGLLSVNSFAFDDHHDRDDRHRYYDEEHKDYHQWNSGEQRYWRNYWTESHRPYISWDRARDEQRREYWRWRHDHDDHHDHDRR